LELKDIPNSLKYKVRTAQAGSKKMGYLRITPIIKEENKIKQLVSFSINYRFAGQKSFFKGKSVSSSVLSKGDWFRFRVSQTGMYILTAEFLASLGMDISSLDPKTLKIYGDGGRMMPLLNRDNDNYDLEENAIQVVGGEDGVFSGGDHILFYGIGTTGLSEENGTNLNLYSDDAYYFITSGGANGKRIGNYVEPTGDATVEINSFSEYQFWEKDEVNIAQIGRRWFGDLFEFETDKRFSFTFPNLIKSEPVELKVLTAGVSESPSNMVITANGQQLDTQIFSAIRGTILGSARETNSTINVDSDTIEIGMSYDKNGNPTAKAFLDYIGITAKRALTGTGNQFQFSYDNAATSNGIGAFNITNASGISAVWDVTNKESISAIANNGAQSQFTFKAALGEERQYVALVPNNLFLPNTDQNARVTNQDIKGTVFMNSQGQFQDVDYLIVTNNDLLNAANRLAEHHRVTNNYNVKVLTLDKIYTEFGGGKQDIVAIRNLVKYVYDNASEPAKRLKYLCLFGDGSVDYKERLDGNNNIVPTFESLSSFSLVSSFATDDFYGCMDPDEGRMIGSDLLDIAVGRILADTPQLANNMVTKIINYSSDASFGDWRNTLMLVADDVDVDWEETIQKSLDVLGDEINARKPFFNFEKIYADSFVQESSSSGSRYPEVNKAISSALEKGALAWAYFGHGGEDGMGKEFLFNKGDINALENTNRYPFVITVTCELTKFDNPLRETAGELLVRNATGGAIGLVSTTRDVVVTFGISVNERLAGFLFPDGSDYPSVAEAVRLMKNTYVTNSKRVIFFFGDPAMKMAIPKPEVRITRINDQPISESLEPLKALSRVKISGEIVDASGNLINDYSGVLGTTIYDKNIDTQTLGNDRIRNTNSQLIILNYKILGEVIFRGKATIKNGLFDFEFVVPKDIAIPVDTGKISFYASRDGAPEDQTGVNETILIGGINENAPEDNVGPQIQLFMNDESFVSGDVAGSSPVLIAKLQDENGINTASGIGHDISAIIDGNEANPFILNDFYVTEIDDFTKGTVTFKLKDIEPGLHTLTFKGWDVYNNSGTQEIQFVVSDASVFSLNNVLNYPNPFVSHTEFWFEHSSSASDVLEVQVQVFTVTGKVIWSKNQTLSGKTSYQQEINWNGKDDFGDKLGKGVYVYKISVKSALTNERVEKFEKLVIL